MAAGAPTMGRLGPLLLLAAAARAADDACAVVDAPGAAGIEVRSLDGALVGNGTTLCIPEAHYRVTLEAETCPQLQCLVPTAVPTPTPSAKPSSKPTPAPTPEPTLGPTTETPAPTVRKSDARTLVTTDDGRALGQADAVALLVCLMLERQEYGSYRLR